MSSHRLLFSKLGRARYISHLDLMHTMQRAFLRAGIEIRHSEGFNPHPYMYFAIPLPVGQESACELMDFELVSDTSLEMLPGILNRTLPEGLLAASAYAAQTKLKDIRWVETSGCLEYDRGVPEKASDRLSEVFERDTLVVTKKSKSGIVETNIRPMLKKISFSQTDDKSVAVNAVVAAQNPSLNPSLIAEAIKRYAQDCSPDYSSFKRIEIYDAEMNKFR